MVPGGHLTAHVGHDARVWRAFRKVGACLAVRHLFGSLVVVGIGFLGLIAYVVRHARQWDDE